MPAQALSVPPTVTDGPRHSRGTTAATVDPPAPLPDAAEAAGARMGFWTPTERDQQAAAEVAHLQLLTAEEEVTLAFAIQAGKDARTHLETTTAAAATAAAAIDTPPPDPEQVRQWQQLVRDGERATERFVLANLRLVAWWARRRLAAGAAGNLDLADLIGAGSDGLVRAVHAFDPWYGVKFSTYGSYQIRVRMARAVERSHDLRLPAAVATELSRMYEARERLAAALGRAATRSELAADLGLSERAVGDLEVAGRRCLSLSSPLNAGGDASSLMDVVADTRALDPAVEAVHAETRRELRRLLSGLPQRQQRVLALRYGLGEFSAHSQDETAAALGVPVHRVVEAETAAVAHLRAHADLDALRTLLTGQDQ